MLNLNFQGANRQFDWLEILLVYDKSDQLQTSYDSYNLELVSRFVQMITLENAANTYSSTGHIEYNIDDQDDKH